MASDSRCAPYLPGALRQPLWRRATGAVLGVVVALGDELCSMIDDFAKNYLHGDLCEVRETMLWKLEGLSEYDVRRPVTPTLTLGIWLDACSPDQPNLAIELSPIRLTCASSCYHS
jgi:hypothetical protein